MSMRKKEESCSRQGCEVQIVDSAPQLGRGKIRLVAGSGRRRALEAVLNGRVRWKLRLTNPYKYKSASYLPESSSTRIERLFL